jgi:anti-sigma factor RsiW
MKEHDLTAWLDGELSAEEEQLVELELTQEPQRLPEVTALIREQFLMAETLIEEAKPMVSEQATDCLECEPDEPDASLLPNEEILTAYVGGQLTDEQAQEVEQQIKSDPVFKRELAEFCRQRFQLAEILEDEPTQTAAPILKFPAARTQAVRTRPTVLASSMAHKSGTPWLKIAAIFAILAAGAWFLTQQHLGDSPQSVSVELKATMGEIQGDVVVLRNTERLKPDRAFQLMSGDTIITGSGQTMISYQDGTTFQIRSDSKAQFLDEDGAKQVMLTQGLASADVAKQATGKALIVRTPQLEVTVLGTAFLLESSQDQSRLDMTEGSVTVTHLHSGSTSGAKAGQSITASGDLLILSESKPRVVSFSLIDADSNQAVPGFDPILPDAALKLSELADRNLTLRANTIPKIMKEVKLKLVGPKGYPQLNQTENSFPYLLTENTMQRNSVDSEVYEPMPELIPGSYTITAEAKTDGEPSATHSLSFKLRP